ncbi:MAG: hypothetical protein QM771_13940 [Nitrospira sp.]
MRLRARAGELRIEIAAIGQAGQEIVQRAVLDMRLGGLEFAVARFGEAVGLRRVLRWMVMSFGRVPVGAEDTSLAALQLKRRDAGTDMPDVAIRPDDAEGIAEGAAPCRYCPRYGRCARARSSGMDHVNQPSASSVRGWLGRP